MEGWTGPQVIRENAALKALAEQGVSADDYEAWYLAQKSDPFWEGKHISTSAAVKNIRRFLEGPATGQGTVPRNGRRAGGQMTMEEHIEGHHRRMREMGITDEPAK